MKSVEIAGQKYMGTGSLAGSILTDVRCCAVDKCRDYGESLVHKRITSNVAQTPRANLSGACLSLSANIAYQYNILTPVLLSILVPKTSFGIGVQTSEFLVIVAVFPSPVISFSHACPDGNTNGPLVLPVEFNHKVT